MAVTGDPNYGCLVIGEECYGPVVDLGTALSRQYTITKDKYDTGHGEVTLYIRGSADPFAWDDESPSWEEYTTTITRSWRYVQLRIGV